MKSSRLNINKMWTFAEQQHKKNNTQKQPSVKERMKEKKLFADRIFPTNTMNFSYTQFFDQSFHSLVPHFAMGTSKRSRTHIFTISTSRAQHWRTNKNQRKEPNEIETNEIPNGGRPTKQKQITYRHIVWPNWAKNVNKRHDWIKTTRTGKRRRSGRKNNELWIVLDTHTHTFEIEWVKEPCQTAYTRHPRFTPDHFTAHINSVQYTRT